MVQGSDSARFLGGLGFRFSTRQGCRIGMNKCVIHRHIWLLAHNLYCAATLSCRYFSKLVLSDFRLPPLLSPHWLFRFSGEHDGRSARARGCHSSQAAG